MTYLWLQKRTLQAGKKTIKVGHFRTLNSPKHSCGSVLSRECLPSLGYVQLDSCDENSYDARVGASSLELRGNFGNSSQL